MARSRENFRERCEAFSILEQEFDKGFALVTVELGQQRVNVLMTCRNFVLVEIEKVVLGEWKSLWPLAAGLTISCRAGLREWKSRAMLPRTMPADASYPSGSPHEHYRIPHPHASLVILH